MKINFPYLIAEIGQAHDGSLGIAHSYIDAISETGVNAVKFQMHIAEFESSEFEDFRINFSYEDKSRFDYWKRMEFSYDQWVGLKKHCEDKKLDFIVSPFSIKALEIINKLGCKTLKLGSGETNNHLLVHRACELDFENILFSNGLCFDHELEETIKMIINSNKNPFLLQCTTNYPCKPEAWNLLNIQKLKHKYNISIGYSDHSGDPASSIAAFSLGAEILEFHVVFDKKMFGPDSMSSLTIKQIKNLTKSISQINKSFNNPAFLDPEKEKNRKIFTKSLAINKDISKGEILKIKDLETKKPNGYGLNPNEFKLIIGKKSSSNLKKGQFINLNNFS